MDRDRGNLAEIGKNATEIMIFLKMWAENNKLYRILKRLSKDQLCLSTQT